MLSSPSPVAIELVPFLVMAIGLDNITTITQCVEASDPSIAVRFRIAEVRVQSHTHTHTHTVHLIAHLHVYHHYPPCHRVYPKPAAP
jgi:hypothetical protein